MSLSIRHAVGLMAVARHSSCGLVPLRLPSLVGSQSLLRHSTSSTYLSNGRPSWVAAAKSKNKRRHEQQEEVDLDSTTELMAELDIDALLNDEEAMKMLRTKLLSEMAAARGQTTVRVPADPAPRSRVFDSDEYDLEALDATETQSDSIDEIAQEAAHKLALESSDIAEHIIADHQHDSMIQNTAKQQRNKQKQQDNRQQQPADFKQSRSRSSSTSSTDSTSSKQGQQQKSSNDGSSSSRGGGTGPPQLAGDTAIGRVAASKSGVPIVVLKKGKARLFEAGSPMVYSGAVDCVIGRPPPVAGDAVVVADYNMVPLAWGVYNPVSMFRVRIMQTESEALSDDSAVLDIPALLDLRISQAVSLRAALGLPGYKMAEDRVPAATNVARLVNSEGDRLSGVVADMLADTIVVQSCAAWSERYREEITAALLKHATTIVSDDVHTRCQCKQVLWRPAAGILKEEGIQVSAEVASSVSESSPLSSHAEESDTLSESPSADVDHPHGAEADDQQTHHKLMHKAVQVREGRVMFLADPTGQKTGFYADQRDNRAFIASMARGKTVLDLCCYSGGFGLMAAAGGAVSVTGVDSSAAAVELATANAQLNHYHDRCAFVHEDVSTFLRAAIEAGEAYDIVILDPPKLAPNKASLARAGYKYRKLNALALSVVRPGGILMTCSCSGAMTQSGGLPKIVQEAAVEAERQVTLLRKSGAGADHPLHPAYPEGEYLTALTYRVN